MFHTFGYTLLIGTVANTDIPAIQDDVIAIQNNHFILPAAMNLFAAYALSPTITEADLISPTLRVTNPIAIRPPNPSAIGTGNPGVYFVQGGGTRLRPFEETQILGSAAPATTERFTAILFAGDSPTPIPQGDAYPVKFTSTGAATPNVWTTIPYGLSTVIPAGVYTMYLSEHFSANAIAHRWIISNQFWRPGMISTTSATQRLPDHLVANWLGTFGPFRSNDLPRLQVLCNAADAVHTGYMYLVKTGNLAA